MSKMLNPKLFFAGFFLAFLGCSLLGYTLSKKASLNNFDRFFSYISASLDYYPTASELLVTAEKMLDPHKTIVLIGGSSIARGDGQNADELWSKKLQKQLGEDYQVLNYGYNGAGFGAFGGVAYRMLSERFPKLIYLSTCSYSEDHPIDGGSYYEYIFWDAYYKGLFHPDAAEQKAISDLRKKQILSNHLDVHVVSWLDSVFYFKSLWNWVAYNHVYTVSNSYARPKVFMARGRFSDDKVDNKARALEIKKTKFDSDLKAVIKSNYPSFIDTHTKRLEAKREKDLNEFYNAVYSKAHRENTVCFLPDYNPSYLSAMPVADKKAYDQVLQNTQKLIQGLGYQARRLNMLKEEDYIDLLHHVESGGAKWAQQAALAVKDLAKNNRTSS